MPFRILLLCLLSPLVWGGDGIVINMDDTQTTILSVTYTDIEGNDQIYTGSNETTLAAFVAADAAEEASIIASEEAIKAAAEALSAQSALNLKVANDAAVAASSSMRVAGDAYLDASTYSMDVQNLVAADASPESEAVEAVTLAAQYKSDAETFYKNSIESVITAVDAVGPMVAEAAENALQKAIDAEESAALIRNAAVAASTYDDAHNALEEVVAAVENIPGVIAEIEGYESLMLSLLELSERSWPSLIQYLRHLETQAGLSSQSGDSSISDAADAVAAFLLANITAAIRIDVQAVNGEAIKAAEEERNAKDMQFFDEPGTEAAAKSAALFAAAAESKLEIVKEKVDSALEKLEEAESPVSEASVSIGIINQLFREASQYSIAAAKSAETAAAYASTFTIPKLQFHADTKTFEGLESLELLAVPLTHKESGSESDGVDNVSVRAEHVIAKSNSIIDIFYRNPNLNNISLEFLGEDNTSAEEIMFPIIGFESSNYGMLNDSLYLISRLTTYSSPILWEWVNYEWRDLSSELSLPDGTLNDLIFTDDEMFVSIESELNPGIWEVNVPEKTSSNISTMSSSGMAKVFTSPEEAFQIHSKGNDEINEYVEYELNWFDPNKSDVTFEIEDSSDFYPKTEDGDFDTTYVPNVFTASTESGTYVGFYGYAAFKLYWVDDGESEAIPINPPEDLVYQGCYESAPRIDPRIFCMAGDAESNLVLYELLDNGEYEPDTLLKDSLKNLNIEGIYAVGINRFISARFNDTDNDQFHLFNVSDTGIHPIMTPEDWFATFASPG